MSDWVALKHEYFPSMCWFCGERQATDLCHSPINKGQFNNRKFHKLLNVKEDAIPGCKVCNGRDDFEFRNIGYNLKCQEFGKEHMDNWLDSLKLRVQENFYIRELPSGAKMRKNPRL